MTVGELRKQTETLSDDFEIVISVDIGGDRPFNFSKLENISVDIGHSDKVIHFFGDLGNESKESMFNTLFNYIDFTAPSKKVNENYTNLLAILQADYFSMKTELRDLKQKNVDLRMQNYARKS